MQRKNQLDEREREICGRLLKFRKCMGLSRVVFAREVGMDSLLLASYENARSQLNYKAAWKILNRFSSLNFLWLAEGDHHVMFGGPRVTIPLPESEGIGPRTLFSYVYDTNIRTAIHTASWGLIRDDDSWPSGYKFTHDANGRACAINAINDIVRRAFERVPPSKVNDLFYSLKKAVDNVFQDCPMPAAEEVRKIRAEINKNQAIQSIYLDKNSFKNSQLVVDNAKITDTFHGMSARKNHLKQLIERVRRATKGSGSKAQLARDFGVSRQAVTKWINEESAPTAETTLQLLEWVQTLEANQQKSPGSASTPPERKTRLGKSHNETPKPSPE